MSEAETKERDRDSDEGDDRPGIGDDERAEFDLDGLAEDIENETAPDTESTNTDETTEEAQEPNTADSGEDTEGPPNLSETPEHSIGDQYVGVLALISATLVEEFGDEESEDPEVVREKVQGIATQEPFDLAANVDLLLAQSGVGTDLPPGKALVLGTVVVVALVVLPETDLLSQAMERVQTEVDR